MKYTFENEISDMAEALSSRGHEAVALDETEMHKGIVYIATYGDMSYIGSTVSTLRKRYAMTDLQSKFACEMSDIKFRILSYPEDVRFIYSLEMVAIDLALEMGMKLVNKKRNKDNRSVGCERYSMVNILTGEVKQFGSQSKAAELLDINYQSLHKSNSGGDWYKSDMDRGKACRLYRNRVGYIVSHLHSDGTVESSEHVSSLELAGNTIGLTRERMRQLLVDGPVQRKLSGNKSSEERQKWGLDHSRETGSIRVERKAFTPFWKRMCNACV